MPTTSAPVFNKALARWLATNPAQPVIKCVAIIISTIPYKSSIVNY